MHSDPTTVPLPSQVLGTLDLYLYKADLWLKLSRPLKFWVARDSPFVAECSKIKNKIIGRPLTHTLWLIAFLSKIIERPLTHPLWFIAYLYKIIERPLTLPL